MTRRRNPSSPEFVRAPKSDPEGVQNQLDKLPKIRYEETEFGDLVPEYEVMEDNNGQKRSHLRGVKFDNKSFRPSSRFMSSLSSRFGFAPSIFSLFTPDEVFGRIVEVHPLTKVRLAIHEQDKALLAVSSPGKPVIESQELSPVLRRVDRPITDAKYADGIVTTTHEVPDAIWEVMGEDFQARFRCEIPIDGYGRPSIFLDFLRLVCTNGMMALSPAFKSEVSLGKSVEDAMQPLARTLDSFNNEEGYQALTQRLEAARRSPASVGEVVSFERAFKRSASLEIGNTELGIPFREMVGDLATLYGVPSASALSTRKQRILAAKCSVADLINFATETVSHRSEVIGGHSSARHINGWLGDKVSKEFDLEGAEDLSFNKKPKAFYTVEKAA